MIFHRLKAKSDNSSRTRKGYLLGHITHLHTDTETWKLCQSIPSKKPIHTRYAFRIIKSGSSMDWIPQFHISIVILSYLWRMLWIKDDNVLTLSFWTRTKTKKVPTTTRHTLACKLILTSLEEHARTRKFSCTMFKLLLKWI